jgi:chromosome segregation ATPase
MEWLIGSSEVDLSPAERAISQLSEDKDAIEEKLKALQEESAKQQYVLHYADTACCKLSCKFTFGRKHLQELADAIEKAKNDEKRYDRNCYSENCC